MDPGDCVAKYTLICSVFKCYLVVLQWLRSVRVVVLPWLLSSPAVVAERVSSGRNHVEESIVQNLMYCVHCGLSVERFQKYSKGNEGFVPPLARYLWNVRLSEALYPTLNCVEIGMRNSVNRAFTAEYGPLWFDTPGLLGQKEVELVDTAKSMLAKARKPLTPEGVVAELNFGFWTTIMSRQHMSDNPSSTTDYLKPWPRLLKQAFPHVPKQELTRSKLSGPLNEIRVLRNRISHHEPIWHQSNLNSTYLDAKRMCYWLTPGMAEVMATIDRFPDVYADGSKAYHASLENLTGWGVAPSV